MKIFNKKWIQFIVLIVISRVFLIIYEPLAGFVFLVGIVLIFVPSARQAANLDNLSYMFKDKSSLYHDRQWPEFREGDGFNQQTMDLQKRKSGIWQWAYYK